MFRGRKNTASKNVNLITTRVHHQQTAKLPAHHGYQNCSQARFSTPKPRFFLDKIFAGA